MTVHITCKGQVIIPKRVRELLNIQPGSAVEFDVDQMGGSPCIASDARTR